MRMNWFWRLLGRLGRRYWVARISKAIDRGYEDGIYNSRLLHALDHRLKYDPNPGRSWRIDCPKCGCRVPEFDERCAGCAGRRRVAKTETGG